jgi:small subunit ribosomal protein S21
MIVIPIKEGENIERALKKFKRKFEKTGVVKELRGRQAYTKPSVEKRQQKLHAVYIQKLQIEEEKSYYYLITGDSRNFTLKLRPVYGL